MLTEYKSRFSYEPERIHAAAVYCSDGRMGAHFDDLISYGLHLPRYDRVALPGGPAALVDHGEAGINHRGVLEHLKFLVDDHELERVLLIAHQGCAFYSHKLGLSVDQLAAQQRRDLEEAANAVRDATGLKAIESYFAHIDGERIRFEHVHESPRR